MRTQAIILDVIEPGITPPYCTHGRTACVGGCGEWLWLGDQTHDFVAAGRAAPLCRPCAVRLIPPDAHQPIRTIRDHLRVDGPHQ